MGRTTFSGPVASQGGFVTPTYTSTTLPYFIPGNIVYVSDLNTLAFGGADQWYRQDSGAGLGTGGNVGPGPGPTPGPTVYTAPADFGMAFVNGMGGTSDPFVISSPTNSALIAKITSLQAGDSFTATELTTPPFSITVTVTGPMTDLGGGQYGVYCNFSQYVSATSGFAELTFA